MQEIIDQILEGNFDYENASLDFSCTKIEIALQERQDYEGSFRILSTSTALTTGYIHSSDLRMECLTPEFSGADEEILFCFHGENMEEGDVIKGDFTIVSSNGEYYLPFVVTMEHAVLDSSIGPIKNLFHFANLAKSNWQEALKIFNSAGFIHTLRGNDAQFCDSCRGLSAFAGNEQNMEEFLVCINKKQPVKYLVQEQQLEVELPHLHDIYGVLENTITVARNGWGYTFLQIACEGDFLFTEKEYLTDDDFLGNHYRLPVFIDSELCRNGRNFGRIFLYNSYQTLEIPVTVKKGERETLHHSELAQKRLLVQLMEFYQAFRLKKISTATWLKETRKLVERLVVLDEKDVASRLFQAQLLITEERYNEAGWLLDHAEELLEQNKKSDGTLQAYYLYLTTLIHREENYVRQVAQQVEAIYRRNRPNWRVAWLLLYLSEEYNRSTAGKWIFLEKQFHYGCTSPVLYIEALFLLNGNPALLRKLDSFSLQVLSYGMKKGAVNADLAEQLLYLAGKQKEYSNVLRKILEQMYRDKEDVRVLQEICVLLIKGGRADASCTEWYEKGMEAQLRITNLYEHYMLSLNLEEMRKLPQMLLMYFSYQSNLDYEHTAYLYDYILQNRDSYSELYNHYHLQIEHFVIDQIQKEHVDRHLANLYQEFLSPGMITEQTAGHLARILFAHLVRVENRQIYKVYVYHPNFAEAREYLLQDGRTWVALYGTEYTLVFEDAYGNRFVGSVEYTLEKLFLPNKYIRMVAHYVTNQPELDYYLCEHERGMLQMKHEDPLTQDQLARMVRVTESEYIDSMYRRELAVQLLEYFYEADALRSMDEYLEKLYTWDFTLRERAVILKYIVLRGRRDMAEKWLRRYGPYFADARTLVILLGDIMEENSMTEDAWLLAAAWHTFRKGKYDSRLLRYLVLYAQGMTRELRDIWKAAQSFDLDTYFLCERMLIQMLYSGAFIGEKMDIFRHYVTQGAKLEVEEAFLRQCCYDFFVREKMTESYIFSEIQGMFQRQEPVSKVAKLAFLKYYAENPQEYTPEQRPAVEQFLKDMLAERIHLGCFREFKDCNKLLLEMEDKTLIEYRTAPGTNVRIHYLIMHENGEAEEYQTESMTSVYDGIYVKEYVLFFGESLQYYITEELNGEERLTESNHLQKSDIHDGSDNSKHEMINDMVISKTLQDYDTLDDLLEEYYRREYWNEQLFHLI